MILVLGGTSDSIKICNLLNAVNKEYIVSVTTNYGYDLASKVAKNIELKKMDVDYMIKFMKENNISLVIDSTHPYAIEVSKNAIEVSDFLEIEYIRYERKSLLDDLDYEKVIKVKSVEEAYKKANEIGSNIFLGTGSKTIKQFTKTLQNKNLVVRVLPTSEVIKMCEDVGLNADNIIAMKGPFSEAINEQMYKHYNIDLVITKESGVEGGFLEKINAAKNLNIPVVVIVREQIDYKKVVNEIDNIKNFIVED
ncbi:precorrin-6A reductase [Paraclostridium ghonii]|uniref:Precorrin-6A/cobalt-precorrin-6A reductase n=1 Tax=Paraclostridium ghonii TaxID=29358 RepID=A0ABU0N4K0_9FIRM|nr:cobalt-precorrin-6A reductase [Paeniclostridium ghonii]MDQ0558088.1 precorrin-6A/cobalt-precorrin-6A reductase [Paeniclostridium ghonii]